VNTEAAFRDACATELAALKPGNVHRFAPGHGMATDDFLRSAVAAAPPLCRPGATLGDRILGAVTATRAAIGQNTNLGIVLLCAPLAQAAEIGPNLYTAVGAVIAGSTLADAGQVFRAIVLAAPGGLGTATRHDVHAPAAVRLPDAMAEAAPRDSIARQWTTGFADVLDAGLPAFDAALARWGEETWAATDAYLRFLAILPDSHVARKHGTESAEAVRREAAAVLARLDATAEPQTLAPGLLAWDADLKRRGLNPGTSADLTVATIFAWHLRNALRRGGIAG
jgi:triphosphoribosyl-dephospho-CoA synthase